MSPEGRFGNSQDDVNKLNEKREEGREQMMRRQADRLGIPLDSDGQRTQVESKESDEVTPPREIDESQAA